MNHPHEVEKNKCDCCKKKAIYGTNHGKFCDKHIAFGLSQQDSVKRMAQLKERNNLMIKSWENYQPTSINA